MKMKRFVTLLLVLCLAFSLAACGIKPIEVPASEPAKTEPAKTEPAKTEPVETAPSTTQPSTTETPTTETPTTEIPTTQAPETRPSEPDDIRGVVTDDVYENRLIGLRITRPDGWNFYSDEQIAMVNNISAELMKGSDLAEYLEKNGQFVDMMMANAVGCSLNIRLQPKQSILDLYSDEQIFSLSEETVKAGYSAIGMNVETYETKTMQVGGKDRTVLYTVITTSGTKVDQYQMWCRNEAKYMGILTLGIADGSDPQPILDCITMQD